LNIIEILRKAHIQSLNLSRKIAWVPALYRGKTGHSYAIIFGVKEALDNSVIVRDMGNRSQDTIKLPKLLEYLKE